MKYLYILGLALLTILPIYAQRPIGGGTSQASPGGGGTQPPAYVAEETP